MSEEPERNGQDGRKVLHSAESGFFSTTIDQYTWDFGGVFFEARERVDNWIQEYLRRWYDFNKYHKGNAEQSHKLRGT